MHHTAGSYLKVWVEANNTGRGEGQGEEMCEREPIPELAEYQHPHNSLHVGMTCPRLQGHWHIPATYNKIKIYHISSLYKAGLRFEENMFTDIHKQTLSSLIPWPNYDSLSSETTS